MQSDAAEQPTQPDISTYPLVTLDQLRAFQQTYLDCEYDLATYEAEHKLLIELSLLSKRDPREADRRMRAEMPNFNIMELLEVTMKLRELRTIAQGARLLAMNARSSFEHHHAPEEFRCEKPSHATAHVLYGTSIPSAVGLVMGTPICEEHALAIGFRNSSMTGETDPEWDDALDKLADRLFGEELPVQASEPTRSEYDGMHLG